MSRMWRLFSASIWTLVAVVLSLSTATLIHDKSFFESAILLSWIATARSRRDAVIAATAYGLFLGGICISRRDSSQSAAR